MTDKATGDATRAAWMLATLRSHPLLASLDDAGLASLVAAGAHKTLRAKRTFLRDGEGAEHVYFLLSGSVRVYHRDGDSELLLKLLRGPAMFGEIEVIARRAYVEHVTTISECQLLAVPAAVFRVLLTRYPDFCAAVLADVACRFCVATKNLKAVAFADVLSRLAAVLLDYAALGSTASEVGEIIDAAVSQESLARELAVSRKAVQNALASLQKRRTMLKRAGRYVIADKTALETLAGLRAELAYSSRAPIASK